MSEMQEFSSLKNDGTSIQENHFDPMAILPKSESQMSRTLDQIEGSLDGQSYFLGEVPQTWLADPKGFLPLNSDRLIGTANVAELLLEEVSGLIQQEVDKIQVIQKRISFWEDRIEKNKSTISAHEEKISQNVVDIGYDKKNRDYWWIRSESVMVDYSNAEASNRSEDWAWLVKKYGLKNADGTEIDAKESAVDELCNGGASNLAGEYKTAGNRYEQSRKDKEAYNNRLIRENSGLKGNNETLHRYIQIAYKNEIEPLQDGVLLFKEFGVRLKALSQEERATYGDLRAWAETFLNDFIKGNSRVPQSVVTEFRKLASIPLPAENC